MNRILRLPRLILENDFLTSSGIITIVNLLNAASNYALIVVVSNILSSEMSAWTALTGVITIFSAPIVAANLDMSRHVSFFAQTSIKKGFAYLYFTKNAIRNIGVSLIGAGLLAILIWAIGTYFSIFSFSIITLLLVVITIYLNLESGTNTQFLIGIIHTKEAAISSLFNGVGRFAITIICILAGFGIYSLPLGIAGGFLGSMVLAGYYISRSHKTYEKEKEHTEEFNLITELSEISQTIIGLTLLSFMLYAGVIISDRFLSPEQSDLFAIIFNFGQITFFGSTAFMSVFMAHSARSKNWKIYLQSLGIVSTITLGTAIFFTLFGSVIMDIFNRSQYTDKLPLILVYLLFIAGYNIIFVSVQYLLSKKAFKQIIEIICGIILLVIFSIGVSSGYIYTGIEPLQSLLFIQVVFSWSLAGYLLLQVYRYNRHHSSN